MPVIRAVMQQMWLVIGYMIHCLNGVFRGGGGVERWLGGYLGSYFYFIFYFFWWEGREGKGLSCGSGCGKFGEFLNI